MSKIESPNLEKVYALTGMSESGKSSVGRFLDENGIKRLKIVDFLKIIHLNIAPHEDFKNWNWRISKEDPNFLYEHFLEELLNFTNKEHLKRCSIESLYSPSLANFLREKLGNRFALVYVDTPEEIRIKRQVIRASFDNEEVAKTYMLERDKFKIEQGVPLLKNQAEITLDNSGDLNFLHNQIHSIIL